jgi:aminoglycoside phosphotransferase (APT) family kinase protein
MSKRDPGPLLAAGRSADVYLLGTDRVVRRYREPYAADFDARREAEVMAYVRERGFPVPQVHDADRADIVMDRVVGPSMLASIARRPWTVRSQARTLASLHGQLHAITSPPWLPAPFGDGDALLHLDLHPDNVLVTGQGVMVIDWQNAACGPVGADLAKTWIILATASVPGSTAKAAMLRAARQLFLRSFLGDVDAHAARSLLPPRRRSVDSQPTHQRSRTSRNQSARACIRGTKSGRTRRPGHLIQQRDGSTTSRTSRQKRKSSVSAGHA